MAVCIRHNVFTGNVIRKMSSLGNVLDKVVGGRMIKNGDNDATQQECVVVQRLGLNWSSSTMLDSEV